MAKVLANAGVKKVGVHEPDIQEYFTYLQSPVRVVWLNFLVGIARGFGFVVGATVVVALVLWLVGSILVEIPVVGNFFEWLNQFLQESLNNSSFGGQEASSIVR